MLALELEGTGITACAFHPEHPVTGMEEGIRDPQDAARVVAYLCTPGATRNGAILERDDAELERAAAALGA